mmetsp:Transcript_6380/g.14716  ORF Transcript_6380/g.14716 Transcript_6380/m.14716 type:complete len:1247 (+) Transcript_6380:85-3825(+)
MAAMKMIGMAMLVAAGAMVPGEDPLVQWLGDLKFALQDVTQEKAGITFTVSKLVCQNLHLTDIQSAVQGVGLSVTLNGIGIECSGHFDYHGLAIVSGSGDLQASVKSSSSSTATVVLQGGSFDKNVPWTVDATSCSASIDFKLKLSGSIVYEIVNLFSMPISALIKAQAVKQACEQLKQQAAGQLSQKLAMFNRLMLPPSDVIPANVLLQGALMERPADDFLEVSFESVADKMLAAALPEPPRANLRVARRLAESGNSGTVDWTHDASVSWMSWLLDDVLGPRKLNQALRWAWKDAKSVAVPGPVTPVASSIIKQPDAGLELKVSAFLKQATIEGADGMSAFTPVEAVGPNDLRFKVSWGTPDRPAFGLGVDVKVTVEAIDLKTSQPQASVEQEMSLHLGLLSPSLDVTGEVLVLEEEWPGSHTLAQFLVAPEACLTSVFKSAPQVTNLQVQFAGLAAPLSFVAKTEGALEASLAALLNNGVTLFNQVYEPLLPGAIQRFAGSQTLMSQLNAQLQQKLKPQQCISPSMASQHARQTIPQYYGNWPPIFDNFVRKWIDNFFDGLIAHNTTAFDEGLSNMPPLKLPFDAKFTLREILATGLNQVSNLRVLVASAQQPSWLGMSAVSKCPTPEAPWKPTMAVNGTVKAGNFGANGTVSLEMPCGTADAELDVVVDLWNLIDMQLPPTMTCALLSPLSKLDIKKVDAIWGGNGGVVVKPDDGPAQEPLKQLCELHPRACELAVKFRKYVSNTDGATHLYHLARDVVLASCTEEPKLSAVKLDGLPKDALGYSYVDAGSTTLWLASVLVVLALSMTYSFCARLGKLLRPTNSACDLPTPTTSLPLATICWFGWRRSESSIPKTATVVTSTLMAAGLVARVLACFWLPFAAAGVEITQSSGATLFKEDALLEYTFFGIGVQFGVGGSLYCEVLWFFMSLASSLTCHAILILVWLTPFLASHRRKLLLIALVLGRFPLSEMETTGNTAMALSNAVMMPLGIKQQLGLGLQAGAYTSWFSTVCTLMANLLLLKLLPRPVKQKDWAAGKAPTMVTVMQGLASCAMIAGICVWWLCDFMEAVTGGLAGALIDPASFSASSLGKTDSALRAMILVTAIVCPCLHVVAFLLGLSGKYPGVARSLAGFAATFCLLDLFAIGYLITFIEGVNGFASSAIRGLAPAVCEVSKEAIGEDCLTMQINVIPLGTAGLLVATGAWNVLFGVQVLGVGQGHPEVRDASTPSTFQECRDPVELAANS